VAVVVMPVMPPVPVMTVVVMAVAVVVVMMAVVPVMAAVMHMTVTAVMAAAPVHHPTAATVAAAMAAAVTAGFSTRGERRQADNNCCGKGEDCSALEHFLGSLCSAEAHPRTRAPCVAQGAAGGCAGHHKMVESGPRPAAAGLTIGRNGRILPSKSRK